MLLATSHKPFFRLLAIIMSISVLSSTFPAPLFAAELPANKGPLQITAQSPAAPLPAIPPIVAPNTTGSGITMPTPPPAAAYGGPQSKGVFVKHESNMPKFDDTPTQFTPSDNLAISPNTETAFDNDLIIDSTTGSGIDLENPNTTRGSELNLNEVSSTTPSSLSYTYNRSNTTGSAISIDGSKIGRLPERKTDGTYPVKNKKAGPYNIGFKSQSGQDLIRFGKGNALLWMSPLTPTAVTGKIKKNSIVYEGIYPDIDLRYTVEDSRLKEDLILNKPTGQTDFTFQLNLNNAGYQVMGDGTINFVDSSTGNLLFYMGKPLAVDKNGNRCDSIKLTLSPNGQLELSVDPVWLSKAVYPVNIDPTIYLPDGQFSRSSGAYTQEGTQVAANQTRFETGKFGQAIMIEEGTTNLLTANQSSAETDLLGWSTNNATITSVDGGWNGSYGAQCSLNAGDSWVGFRGVPFTAGSTYTFSIYAKGTAGRQINLRYNDGTAEGSSSVFTLSSVWQRFSYTFTISASAITLIVFIRDAADAAQTFYVDGCQVEKNSYATSWMMGGTGRTAETLTIPTNDIISANQGSIEVTAYIDPAGAHAANNPNWSMIFTMVDIQASPYEERNQISIRRWSGTTDWVVEFSNASGNIAPINLGNITTPGWYSFGVTWQSGVGGYGYLNGTNRGSVAASYLPSAISAPIAYIGSWTGNNQFDQLIDDLRISNCARSASEIQAGYASNQPLPIDDSTTCKMNFDGNLRTTDIWGTGNQPYWNYTSASLGGGFNTSVNTFNLNMLISKSLFSIPGRGIPIGESITYNSIDGGNSPLGIGWHLGSDTSLTECRDGSVIFNQGDGGALQFTPNGSGGYTPPPGIYLTLQKTSPGNYTITDKNQNVYTYQNGKPTQIVDRNGNPTTYTYDFSGRLNQQVDPSGRTLTYTYNPSGQLASVTDPASRAYRFNYQGNYLMGITDPANNTFTLAYDLNGHLSSFTDPLSRVTTFAYNLDGTLQYYRDARTNGQDVYQTTYAQTTEGNQLVTTVTDPGSHIYTYYCDSNTGNLQKYVDGVGDTWQYTWNHNNLMSVQDAKGTTSYTYDNNGNMLTKTTTVDSDPADNITETMTYDRYNQLIKVVDGSGRVKNYQYDVKGNLLSTNNPNNKESNGKLYDPYGNVIQSTPATSASQSLLSNGSFEYGGWGYSDLIVNGWIHAKGGASVNLVQGQYNTHGNQALTMSSEGSTTDYYYQNVSANYGDKLTLRADITQIMPNDSTPGATIRISYNNGYYDSWTCYGSGSFPVVVTSRGANPLNFAVASVGFYNGCGQIWFDGVQLEDMGSGSLYGDNYGLSAFNSVENGGFENGQTSWQTASGNLTITSTTAYQGANSAVLALNTSGTISFYQEVPVHSGEPLTLVGMVRPYGVTGPGAYYQMDYYNSSGQYISTVQTGYLTGTQDFTELTCLATAPSGAYYGRLSGVLTGMGTAYFDNIKLLPRITQLNTYDSSGNYLNAAEDPLGNKTAQTYDTHSGNLTSSSDALNNTAYYSYDNLNRLIQVTDPNNKNAYYGYDGDSNLTASRDPRSSSATDNTYDTNFTPNPLNQLGSLTDPLSKNTNNYYDRSGNLETVNLPNGLSLNYQYDNANRMTKKTLDNSKYFNYSYDGADNLTGVVDQDNNSYALSYDGANRVAGSTDPLGNTLSYQYDKSHNITSENVNNTGTIGYYYGSSNQMTWMNFPGGYYLDYSYDENGRLFQIQYFGGVNHNIIDQPNGWCQSIEDNAFPGSVPCSYSYNANGTISNVKSWAGKDNYTYDNLGRLTGWSFTPTSGNPVQESYVYDQAGNLTTKGSRSYSYNAANQINGFVYDANGNLTNDGVYTYTYDAENKLTSVTGNGLNVSYTYYYNGLRKSKTVNGVTTNYTWDAFGRLVKESPSNGNPIYYFYDAKGNPVGFGNLTYNREGDAVWQIYYYHTNQRGDIISITDQNGTIQEQYNYDPWGDIISSSGTLTQSLRYAGYYYDSETGLYYLQNRYYSPTLGRFLTKDAIGNITKADPQSLNLYTYARNNPVSIVDPNGNFIQLIIAAGFALAGIIMEAGEAFPEIVEGDSTAAEQITIDVAENGSNYGVTETPVVEDANDAGASEAASENSLNWGNPDTLQRHYDDHGPDFGASSPEEYAQDAQDFYSNRGEYQQKVDDSGVTRVYDSDTNTFGSYNPNGSTKTFFKPKAGQVYFDRQPGILIGP